MRDVQQQTALGGLNGHVAEMYAGHTIVTAFGHQQKSIAIFEKLNADYYDGAWRAQFVTGIIWPTIMFVGNIGYVLVAVIGGVLVTRGSIAIGDVQAFIAYSRQMYDRLLAVLPHRAETIFHVPYGIPLPQGFRRPGDGRLRAIFAGRIEEKQKGVFPRAGAPR